MANDTTHHHPGKPADISEDILIAIYEAQWEDIHHSRNQDWELAKVVLAGFLGLSGLSAFNGSPLLILWLSGGFVVLSIIGMLVTVRHDQLFTEKMDAIRLLEGQMQITQLELFKSRRSLVRFFKVQLVLILMYFFSAILFVIFILSTLKYI